MSEGKSKDTTNRPGKVFYISTILVALFVGWGVLSPGSLNTVADNALEWMITNFGWFYMIITAFFVLFVIIIAISPYGNIKLGKDDEKPEFSYLSWIGMLFAAGVGVGFVFFGVAEPVLYYVDPPVGIEPGTTEAAVAGLRYGAYHWSLHPWAIFSVVGLTMAYVQFRKGRPALISSAFYPILGRNTNGFFGQTIDVLSVIATTTGVATTFGLSAIQITGGLSYLTPIPNTIWVQITLIIIVTVLFMFSAAKGLDKGIKTLSNINIAVAGVLLFFVIVFGPTLFIAENFVTTLGGYVANFVQMSLTLTPFSESGWLGRNTIFFWAWHISWAPFIGLFIARISRGRTVRQFIGGVLLIPSFIAVVWFTVFGSTALNVELYGVGGLSEVVTNNVELALFATLENLPFGLFTSFIGILLIFIFFVTSADSATYVLGTLTSKGSLQPTMRVKFVWGVLIAGTASVLLISGDGGIDALQTASLVAAFPFSIVMALMVVSMLIMFSRDTKVYKRKKRTRRNESVKEEFREEFYDDVREEVRDEVYGELKDDVYGEIKEEVYDDIKDEIKENIYDEFDKDPDIPYSKDGKDKDKDE